MSIKRPLAVIGFPLLAGMLLCSLFALNYIDVAETAKLQEYVIPPVFVMFAGIAVIVFAAGLGFLAAGKAALTIACFSFAIGAAVMVVTVLTECVSLIKLDGKETEINGTVINKSTANNDTTTYTIKTILNNVSTFITLYSQDTAADIGDALSFKAELHRIRNNVNFAESQFNFSKGIMLQAEKKGGFQVTKNRGLYYGAFKKLYLYREKTANNIVRFSPNETTLHASRLLSAILLGDKNKLDYNDRETLKRAGISHYTSVSGLHITIIVHTLVLFLNLLLDLDTRKRLKFIIIFFSVTFLMLFFGFTISVVRSGIMMLICYSANLFLRNGDTFNSLGFAILLILAQSPFACLDAGFLLSLFGTFGIGVVAPKVNSVFSKKKPTRLKKLRELFIGTICANCTTLPLMIVCFNGVSLAAPAVNVLLTPFVTVAVIAAGIYSTGHFIPFLWLGSYNALVIMKTAEYFSRFKYSWIALNYSFLVPFCIIAVTFVSAVQIAFGKFSVTIKSVLISFAVLTAMTTYTFINGKNRTYAEVYSTRAGGALLLRNGNDAVIVASDDNNETMHYIQTYLNDNGCNKAGILCIISPKKDNEKLVNSIPSCKTFYGQPTDALYSVSGKFTFQSNSTGAIITSGNLKFSFSDAKQIIPADVEVIYTKVPSTLPEQKDALIIFTNENPEYKFAYKNAFYEKQKYWF
jgi:ComEC/Rec2-related protein